MVSKAIAKRPAAPARKRPAAIAEAAIEVEVEGFPTAAVIEQALREKVKLHVADEDEGGVSVLLSTLANATTADDLFAGSELEKLTDHLGETLVIRSLDAVRNSDFDEGALGVYAIVTAVVHSTGELVKIAIGATEPFAIVCALHEMDALPRALRFERSEKTTKAGFRPINVVDAGSAENPF
jgi:hypothetical protein